MTKEESAFERKIRILSDPGREASLPAEELLKLVTIQENDIVLDIGAGTGYVTIPAAKKTTAPVYALDLDEEILDYLVAKAKETDIHHIESVVGDFMKIPLEDDLVNVAIASMSLHEVTSLSVALGEIHRVLRENGQFLCVEYEVKEKTDRPRVSSVEMEKGLKEAGFYIKEIIYPNAQFLEQDLYIVIAEKQ